MTDFSKLISTTELAFALFNELENDGYLIQS